MKKLISKPFILGIVAITALALALRFVGMDRLYDIHIDEVTYDHFAKTIASGHLPLLLNGDPFFLHPPGYFALLALWRDLVWRGGDLFSELMAMRGLNVILGSISTLLVAGITRRLTGSTKLGLVAGALFAIDPFAIRHNTRSLMETATMMWLLGGFWLMLRNQMSQFSRWQWALTGLLFGLAMVTKDVAVIFLVLAFGMLAIFKIAPVRRAWRYLVPTALAPYSIWLLIVAINGYAGQFLEEKTRGIRRFLGLLQETGFNSTNSPSKTDTLLQTLVHYGPSYAIMGFGVLGTIVLLTSKNVLHRWWGSIATAATLLMGYTYVAGAMEEQYLYYLLVPSIITTVIAGYDLWQRTAGRKRRFIKIAGIILGVLLAMYGAVAYSVAIKQADNGWTAVSKWVYNNATPGSSISVFGQGQFFFEGHDFVISQWHTPADLKTNHVNYIIVSDKLSLSGYTPLSAKELGEVYQTGQVVFTYDSRDSGVFHVVKLPDQTPPPVQVASTNLPDTGATLATGLLGMGSMFGMSRLYLRSRRAYQGALRRVSLDRWR